MLLFALGWYLCDGCSKRGFAMIHMPDGAHIHVGLCAAVDVIAAESPSDEAKAGWLYAGLPTATGLSVTTATTCGLGRCMGNAELRQAHSHTLLPRIADCAAETHCLPPQGPRPCVQRIQRRSWLLVAAGSHLARQRRVHKHGRIKLG